MPQVEARAHAPVTPCRYVEWTPADEPSRRRGRVIVQSERNVDFLRRLKARHVQASATKTEADIVFAQSLLSENFLFSQARVSARAARLTQPPSVARTARADAQPTHILTMQPAHNAILLSGRWSRRPCGS